MVKVYSLEGLVNHFLGSVRLSNFSRAARMIAATNLDVIKSNENRCYTSADWRTGPIITLGTKFYSEAFGFTDRVDVLDLKARYKHMAQCYLALFFHELFHVLFTDLDYVNKTLSKLDYSFKDFSFSTLNILEDVTIEGSGCKEPSCKSAKEHLDILNELHTREATLKKVSEMINEDPKNPGTLLSFLLLMVRGYDVSLLPKYDLYENNKDFIRWGAYKCINTGVAQLRHNRQIAYAKQLCKILDLKEPSKDEVEEGSVDEEFQGPSSPMSSKAQSVLKPTMSMAQELNPYKEFKNSPKEIPEEVINEDFKEPTQTVKAGRSNIEEGPQVNSAWQNPNLGASGIATLANDDPVTRFSHKARRLDEFMNTSNYAGSYKAIVKNNEKQIRAVVAMIRKMKGENNTSWNHYQMKGKFDVSTVIKRGNYKFFKTKNAPSQEADLVFEILVDNSGSMSGSKSKLAGEALIIFAEALNRLNIPFAVDAFTEYGSCITIQLKEFQDNYDKVKTNMTLLTDQYEVRELGTFYGNIDEVNLMYVRDVLNQQRQQDKVCIVISDGATCGSEKDLRRVAQSMEKDGITVLGIGVYDNNVSKIYDNHIILKNQRDLEGLGAFLNKYLVRKIFK